MSYQNFGPPKPVQDPGISPPLPPPLSFALPLTRRGILSTVDSIYDPNWYLAPVILKWKRILHQMCRDKLDWDDPVPDILGMEWEKWQQDILHLESLQIKRCFKPECFGRIKSTELHHFFDASLEGYG